MCIRTEIKKVEDLRRKDLSKKMCFHFHDYPIYIYIYIYVYIYIYNHIVHTYMYFKLC